jgi:hypothetical protein
MSREQDIGRIQCDTIAVPVGFSGTAGLQLGQTSGFYGFGLKYVSGGSLSVYGASAASSAMSYLLGTSEVMNVNQFTGKFYLFSTGSTATVSIVRQFTTGE